MIKIDRVSWAVISGVLLSGIVETASIVAYNLLTDAAYQ